MEKSYFLFERITMRPATLFLIFLMKKWDRNLIILLKVTWYGNGKNAGNVNSLFHRNFFDEIFLCFFLWIPWFLFDWTEINWKFMNFLINLLEYFIKFFYCSLFMIFLLYEDISAIYPSFLKSIVHFRQSRERNFHQNCQTPSFQNKTK
jgi:hypothetical protein